VIALDRFKQAQDGPSGFATALAELEAGRKRSHWIWYVFPQLAVWDSPRRQSYGLQGADEAAYLRDRVLRDSASRYGPFAQLSAILPALVDVMGSRSTREARLVHDTLPRGRAADRRRTSRRGRRDPAAAKIRAIASASSRCGAGTQA
jgi:hypothetical protein